MVLLTDQPIDVAALEAAVDDPACGAVVTFRGRVRDHHHGKAVDHLEYEAFEPMAVAELEQLLVAARAEHGIARAAVAHRLGRLEIGDDAVAVVVSSAHRAEAFVAGRWIMDRIKQVVPIWKHEFWADGSDEWVGPGEDPCAHAG